MAIPIKAALAIGVSVALVAQAQGPSAVARSADGAAPTDEAAEGIDLYVTAARVADYGRRFRDAAAMILAARLLSQVAVEPVDLQGTADGGIPSDRGAPHELEPLALLEQARDFAEGDADTLADIAEAEAAARRGVVRSAFGRGPIYAVRDVGAMATYRFHLSARAGEMLRVSAIGDGDTDIDLVIRDEAGAVVCEDRAYDHYPVCTLAPDGDRRFRVDIINHGRVWTRVRILSN